MNKEELIGKLQMVYVGDRNALNELVGYYDGLKQGIEQLQQENKQLKEAIKRCYTPEEIDFEIMPVKAELEAEKDINNNLHKTIDKLRVNLYETQQQRDLYKEVIEELINWLESKNKIILQQHNIVEPVIKVQEVIDKIKEDL